MCYRTEKYTVRRRVRVSFSQEILQAGAVKGLSQTNCSLDSIVERTTSSPWKPRSIHGRRRRRKTLSSTPQYLADRLQIYTPSRTLRSTADTRKLKIPLFKKKYSGQRFFSYHGPVTWNYLPFSIRHTQTYSSFKSVENLLDLPNLPVEPSLCCSLYLICNHEMFPWYMYCCIACMSGLHWLFRDVCMFACALLLTLDRLVYACFMYWFWCPFLFWIVKCFEPF